MSKIEKFQNPYDLAEYLETFACMYSKDYGAEILHSDGRSSGYHAQDGVEVTRGSSDVGGLQTKLSFTAERIRETGIAGRLILVEYEVGGIVQQDELNLKDMPDDVRDYTEFRLGNKKKYKRLQVPGSVGLQIAQSYYTTSEGVFDHEFSLNLCYGGSRDPTLDIPEELWEGGYAACVDTPLKVPPDWNDFMAIFSPDEVASMRTSASAIEDELSTRQTFTEFAMAAQEMCFWAEADRMRYAGNLARTIFSTKYS